MRSPEQSFLFTCEHGGNRVPSEYHSLFAGKAALLSSHRGWDRGALPVARALSSALDTTLLSVTTTRLLVDLNRSPHNPGVFSKFTRNLPPGFRDDLLATYHRPHWDRVRAAIASTRGRVLHVAVHSFTPVWKGTPRRFAVGILYDPKRGGERSFAIDWQRRLREHLPATELRRNAPYRGDADGLATAMRREHSPKRYLGIELELNQRVLSDPRKRRALVGALERTLRGAAANL